VQGSADGVGTAAQFYLPYDVATDASGNVYVSDTSNNRIQKFNSSGGYLLQWGEYGFGNGQFNTPLGIAAGSAGDVYIVDSNSARIQKFDGSGMFQIAWGSFGTADGEFFSPDGVAVSPAGDVYVTDRSNDRVQRFNANGGFMGKWGSSGTGDGQFHFPEGVAVDPSGNVYVSDENHRIQKFTYPSASVGSLRSAGVAVWAHPNPFNPTTLVSYSIPISGRATLRVYDTSGTLVSTLVDAYLVAGRYTARWNGIGGHGEAARPGVYFALLKSSAGASSYKLTLLE